MEIVEQVANTYGSKLWRMQNLYKIRDKKAQLTTLRFNSVQRQILADIMPAWRARRPIRHFDLKSRQQGVSTFWLLWWLDETITHNNTITGVLAHKLENLKILMEIARIAYEHLPERWRPGLETDSTKEYAFAGMNSKFFMALSVRSTALHNLHISEWCFCADEEIRATMGAVSPYTNVSGESTGNGVGNDGYETYMTGKEKTGPYQVRFFPWFVQEEYRLPVAGLPTIIPTDAEKRFMAKAKKHFGVDVDAEQLNWRRSKIGEVKEDFPQEFPEEDEDAFRTMGTKFFDHRKIGRLSDEARDFLKGNPPVAETDDFVQWEKPVKGHMYAAGADTADTGADYSVLKIIDCTTRREVFRFRARCGVDFFYRQCDKWGRVFNNALLCVELNNHGRAVILGLEILKYPHLYEETNVREKVLGIDNPKARKGWLTTSSNRDTLVDHLKFALEGAFEEDEDHFMPEIFWRDEWLFRECLTFEQTAGKYQAAPGKHDDVIFASAFAVQMFLRCRRSISREAGGSGYIIGGQREAVF